MKNLLNPKWLYLINTTPLILLLLLFWSQYSIIKTILDADTLHAWRVLGIGLLSLTVINFGYTFFLDTQKKETPIEYSYVALVLYVGFLYLMFNFQKHWSPSEVPNWMLSEDIQLFTYSFFIPTILYSIIVLVVHFTPNAQNQKAWISFILAFSLPLVSYLFMLVLIPLLQGFNSDFPIHILTVMGIAITILFQFFLIRSVYIIASQSSVTWNKYKLFWKIPITILLPLIGLMINNGTFFKIFSPQSVSGNGIIGDFNNYWFYILAIINGILLCMPEIENKLVRLMIFALRSLTFSYTLYFFIIFLPFLPFSILAIIFAGTGILLLSPLLLFIVHVIELSKDFALLKSHISKFVLLGVSVISLLIIPIVITIHYTKDKQTLNLALEYIYSPQLSTDYQIDLESLQNTLTALKNQNKSNRSSGMGSNAPFLTSYYKWLVLDNLSLPSDKTKKIENIFYGKELNIVSNDEFENNNSNIDSITVSLISVQSAYDSIQQSWKSTVDIELTNHTESIQPAEFETKIQLPVGCWISDYYLFVGNKKEPGIHAEKKSALWIFRQIRNENKDPGILYYISDNLVAFRVFPFAEKEIRKTGIEFIHKEPVKINIAGQIVDLGKDSTNSTSSSETEHVAYVSAMQKTKLPKVKRDAYFHFLVDVSKNDKEKINEFIEAIDALLKKYPELSKNAKISFVNSYVHTVSIDSDWKHIYRDEEFKGGFYLDRAIRLALNNSNRSSSYPVIVVISNPYRIPIIENNYANIKMTFPETDLYYQLQNDGTILPHSLLNTRNPLSKSNFEISVKDSVLKYKLSENQTVYLPDDHLPSIALKKNNFKLDDQAIKPKNWLSALDIHGFWYAQNLIPMGTNKDWRDLVRYSFLSNIMTPVSSYLVVENEAQKAVLKQKQKQVLSSNKAFEIDDSTSRMSETSLWILGIFLALLLWVRSYRLRRKTNP